MSILLSLTLLPAGVTAEPSTRPNQTEEVCKRLGAPTGSRLGQRRVCNSRTHWEDERIGVKQALEKAQTSRGLRGD